MKIGHQSGVSPPARRRGYGVVLACLIVLVGGSDLYAQVVAGVVQDAESEEPLTGVLVSLLDLNGERIRGVLTDDQGSFQFDVGRFGRYSLRAERIGLQTATSSTFDLFGSDPHFERVLMGSRAVEIAGLVVDSRVRQCVNDPAEAVQIQRWWREVRTALDVSSIFQSENATEFEIARYEREWGPDLERTISMSSREEVSVSPRPFVSADADYLADGGFVQGDLRGQREYYAPDADVLLSNVFLAQHCFRVVDHDDNDGWVGLAFEPSRDTKNPEIAGTLWVDSASAELRHLDYRYRNMAELPANESGGYVGFEYLESGAWIVDEWYIRMPKLAEQRQRGELRLVLLGYVDVGGHVELIDPLRQSVVADGEIGSIRGVVHDSIRGGGLSGALVTLLGSRRQTRSGPDGSFMLTRVPVGSQRVTFFHDDPEAWGLGATVAEVEVRSDRTSVVELGLPTFRQAAIAVCMGSGAEAETVLLGKLVDQGGTPLGNVPLVVRWTEASVGGLPSSPRIEARTGSDGRFVLCRIPAEARVRLSAEIDGRWIEGFEATLPARDIVFRQLMVPM